MQSAVRLLLTVAVVCLAGNHVTGETGREDITSVDKTAPLKRIKRDVPRLEQLIRTKRSHNSEEEYGRNPDTDAHSRTRRCHHCPNGHSRGRIGHHNDGHHGPRNRWGRMHHARGRGHGVTQQRQPMRNRGGLGSDFGVTGQSGLREAVADQNEHMFLNPDERGGMRHRNRQGMQHGGHHGWRPNLNGMHGVRPGPSGMRRGRGPSPFWRRRGMRPGSYGMHRGMGHSPLGMRRGMGPGRNGMHRGMGPVHFGMRRGIAPGPYGMPLGHEPKSFNMRYIMGSGPNRMQPGPSGQGIGPDLDAMHPGVESGLNRMQDEMRQGQYSRQHGQHGMGHGSHGMSHRRRGHGCPHCGPHRFSHHSHGPDNNGHHGHSEVPLDGIDPDTHLPVLPPNVQRKLDFLSSAQNLLTVQLHREIAVQQSNVVYSPYGIFHALSMIFMGSNSFTAFQMIRLLHLIGMGRHIHLPVMHQNILLDNPVNSTLEVANGVFINSNATVKQVFGNLMESSFGANISLLQNEHADDPEGILNDAIDSQTNSEVSEVLLPDAISLEPSSLLLLNVMYFKGKWKTPFQLEQAQQMFHQSPTQQVPVDMMNVEGMFKMGVLPGHPARLLELPYANERFSMIVVLPEEMDGLLEIEENLSTEDFSVRLETIMPSMMKVTLPKFKLKSTFALKENLQHIGMTRAFSADASDLSPMSFDNLHVHEIIHKVVVEVMEDGDDISSNSIPETAQEGEMPEFRCNRPFLFIIRDNVSKVNLFIGKFSGRSDNEDLQ